MGTPAESALAPAILRGLGDRSYDKRKNAALEIEALIKTLEDNNETDRICSIIVLLGQDFATSTNPNHRKGGLIGLAASSIGLMSVRVVDDVARCKVVNSRVQNAMNAEHLKSLDRARASHPVEIPFHRCPVQVYQCGTRIVLPIISTLCA